MEQEFIQKLEALKSSLEGKTKDQVDAAVKSFEETFEAKATESMNSLVGEAKSQFESKAAEIEKGLAEVKEYASKLDAKMNEVSMNELKAGGFESRMQKFIKDNGERIQKFRKGMAFDSQELKAVGNMTTANLTGDEEREYSRDTVIVPGRLIHFVDLCGPDVNVGVGTYTYPRETGAGEGAIAAQTEGSDKSQRDYDFTNVDVATDFIAGFAVYSKKMRNNLPFLESFLPVALRRDYMNAEDAAFETVLSAAATASAVTSGEKIERIFKEVAALAGANHAPNGIVMTPADYFDVLVMEKSTGAGYGLPPGVVVEDSGLMRILGTPTVWSNWMTANEYYVGDWSRINRVVTEGLSLEFSEHDEDNFRKNNITARIEAQVGLAVHQPSAIILGDFTAT